MPSAQDIYAVLEARRLELGLSQAEVGNRAFGKPDNSAFQALRRGSSPAADKLASLCEALELEFYFGTKRQPEPAEQVYLEGNDYAHIPLHQATLSAGPGSLNGDSVVIDHLAFRRDWLRRIGVVPEHAKLARVTGDSMAPALSDGDVVMIDTSDKEVRPGNRDKHPRRPSIFAFVEDGEARVKRIDLIDDDLFAIISDNPDHPPQYRRRATLFSMHIIGKVVWWGHTVRD